MSLNELLARRKITKVLIVDDGFDETPRASDLRNKNDEWTNFFDDLKADKLALVQKEFPAYTTTDLEILKNSDPFVATIWRIKDQLGDALSKPLFEQYQQATETDMKFLKKLIQDVESFGLNVVRAGREIPEDAKDANLIFVDLFLGSAQTDTDIEFSINKLKELLVGRESEPPIVILMSSSTRLLDKKSHFRDGAKLLGALFRCFNKSALEETVAVESAVNRLVRSHEDGIRLAKFLHAWDRGLDKAQAEFLKIIRRIDLSDYAQIQQVLLNFEGQPLGSYVLDVFDGMLQYQIEEDSETIATANELNKINPESYPSRHITDSPDLQELVFKTTFQNPKRLEIVSNGCGAPVAFGDVLVHRTFLVTNSPAKTDEDTDVLVTLSPACDLARPGAKRVLLLGGVIKELDPETWSYSSKARSPIIILNNNKRMSIEWNLKDFQTWKISELRSALEKNYSKVMCMRETQALELQQKLLSDIGRVGVMAQLPANFEVRVEVLTCNTDGSTKKLSLPQLEKSGGVCFRGRDKDSKPHTRMVLSEPAVDELLAAIQSLNVDSVPARAKDTLERLKESSTLINALDQGLLISDGRELLDLKVPMSAPGQGEDIIGLIIRNPVNKIDKIDGGKQKHGTIIIVIKDNLLAEATAMPADLTEELPIKVDKTSHVVCAVANAELKIIPKTTMREVQSAPVAEKKDIGS